MDIQESINGVLNERIKIHERNLNRNKKWNHDGISNIAVEQRLIEVKFLKKLINDKFKEYRGEF